MNNFMSAWRRKLKLSQAHFVCLIIFEAIFIPWMVILVAIELTSGPNPNRLAGNLIDSSIPLELLFIVLIWFWSTSDSRAARTAGSTDDPHDEQRG